MDSTSGRPKAFNAGDHHPDDLEDDDDEEGDTSAALETLSEISTPAARLQMLSYIYTQLLVQCVH